MLKEIRFVCRDTHYNRFFLYQCSCGKKKVMMKGHVDSGKARSCGCSQRLIASKLGKAKATHGETIGRNVSAEYMAWCGMKSRCNNSHGKSFKYYGGRGITICKRWRVFKNFLADMGRRPKQKYSLDRIDNNGNYEPRNCRWASLEEQSRNKSSNRYVLLNGEKFTLVDAAKKLGKVYSSFVSEAHRKQLVLS